MLQSSLFYSNHLELLSMKQRQQLILYLKDIKNDEDQIIFGY
jgi:hypothetical protein